MLLPERLTAESAGGTWWIEMLPDRLAAVTQLWTITVFEPFQPGGATTWVAPARTADGSRVAVKLAWRHYEAEHEADGLRLWDGNGTVQLLAVELFADTTALLLERCDPGTALSERPEIEQDEVIAGLLRRLWSHPVPAAPFRPLREMCDRWAAECDAKRTRPEYADADRGLISQGVELLRTLPDTAPQKVLLATDLHAGNVLAACREPCWASIPNRSSVTPPTTQPNTSSTVSSGSQTSLER